MAPTAKGGKNRLHIENTSEAEHEEGQSGHQEDDTGSQDEEFGREAKGAWGQEPETDEGRVLRRKRQRLGRGKEMDEYQARPTDVQSKAKPATTNAKRKETSIRERKNAIQFQDNPPPAKRPKHLGPSAKPPKHLGPSAKPPKHPGSSAKPLAKPKTGTTAWPASKKAGPTSQGPHRVPIATVPCPAQEQSSLPPEDDHNLEYQVVEGWEPVPSVGGVDQMPLEDEHERVGRVQEGVGGDSAGEMTDAEREEMDLDPDAGVEETEVEDLEEVEDTEQEEEVGTEEEAERSGSRQSRRKKGSVKAAMTRSASAHPWYKISLMKTCQRS
ncbi:hypothetical protein M407DRAFT_17664 [Tulasnella calospora MUT 4182]|uniref:Uncharacterized protein n=1 Tax=Tulasnella calospora MUT 4182 TaxID=1051891 RepID=A0A0C3QWT6_9AGAM|nr:hypothetical protein M407DRAFT_17664 [Tulasnella calospora MUT 4182]